MNLNKIMPTQFGKIISCNRMSYNLWKIFVESDGKLDNFVIESHYEILINAVERKWWRNWQDDT